MAEIRYQLQSVKAQVRTPVESVINMSNLIILKRGPASIECLRLLTRFSLFLVSKKMCTQFAFEH